MNDSTIMQPALYHYATQKACRHWAPIISRPADEQDAPRENLAIPQPEVANVSPEEMLA